MNDSPNPDKRFGTTSLNIYNISWPIIEVKAYFDGPVGLCPRVLSILKLYIYSNSRFRS